MNPNKNILFVDLVQNNRLTRNRAHMPVSIFVAFNELYTLPVQIMYNT